MTLFPQTLLIFFGFWFLGFFTLVLNFHAEQTGEIWREGGRERKREKEREGGSMAKGGWEVAWSQYTFSGKSGSRVGSISCRFDCPFSEISTFKSPDGFKGRAKTEMPRPALITLITLFAAKVSALVLSLTRSFALPSFRRSVFGLSTFRLAMCPKNCN